MKRLYAGLLIWLLLAALLAGCEVGAPAAATPTITGAWGYTSQYLKTSYPGALSVMNQLALGTLKLEGTANAVTAEQARTLLPLWQLFQGSALRDDAERRATLVAIEKAMTPAQLQAIAALQLTESDLQSWAQEQGLSFGLPGGESGTGPSTDARATMQARFGTMTEAEREAMRATIQAGGGFPGGQGARGTRTAGSSGNAWTGGALLRPLIALLTQRAGGSANATRIPVTPTPTSSPATPTPTPTATAASEPTPTATQTSTARSTPAASSSGTSALAGKLAVRGADGIIYVVNVDGTGLHAVTNGIDPTWSPDGKKIAFVRWSEPWGLFTINADGTAERQLISDKDLRQPDWSPNGEIIVVVKGRLETVTSRHGPPGSPGRETQVWAGVLKGVNPDSGAYYDGDYPAHKYVQSPSWAPDSVHLAFENERGINITAKGEDPRLLTPTLPELTYSTPAWSPAGDRIAYTREMHGYWEIWSMKTDGSERWQLTAVSAPGASAYNNVCPAWSPDGQYIAFLTDRSGQWEVWVMRADGSDQHRLLDLPLALTYAFNGDRVLDWGR